MFELVDLVGERFDLLCLVVDHLPELRDLLRGVDDRLNGVCRGKRSIAGLPTR